MICRRSAPPKKTLEQQDRIKIDLEIFGWLLQRHFGDDGAYSAIFLQAEEAETAVLMKHLSGTRPAHQAVAARGDCARENRHWTGIQAGRRWF